MSARVGDINARIESARQIAAVVTVMRATAATRAREARKRLDSVRAYAQSIGEAIARVLPLASDNRAASPRAAGSGPGLVIAVGAEQGFAGGFSERILQAVSALTAQAKPDDELMLLGDRTATLARARGFAPSWSHAMAAHLDQIESLSDRVADQLSLRLAQGISRVTLVHATPFAPGEAVMRQLIPFDYDRFPLVSVAAPPLLNVAPDRLLSRLAEEFVFAEICEALTLSFSAENEARIQSMNAAHSHVTEILEALSAQARQARQEEITAEIIELAVDTNRKRPQRQARACACDGEAALPARATALPLDRLLADS